MLSPNAKRIVSGRSTPLLGLVSSNLCRCGVERRNPALTNFGLKTEVYFHNGWIQDTNSTAEKQERSFSFVITTEM
jgi:hypothetical protein